ncbi:hypothetical protein F4860DRAFT_235970 [Xylaria cubensis]|nr:hypothetical protein F4860DRAFT_235970 [Xylaria cubensis]
MPPTKKKSQTRLSFEAAGTSSSSPVSAYSPARVRYLRAAYISPAAARRLPSIATSSSPAQTVNSARKRKSKQSRLDDFLGLLIKYLLLGLFVDVEERRPGAFEQSNYLSQGRKEQVRSNHVLNLYTCVV